MKTIICSGPVIIENNRVLLIKEKKPTGITPWFFPGGKLEKGETPEQACLREAREEIGADTQIIRPLPTLTDYDRADQAQPRQITLIHWLCRRQGEIKPGPTVIEYDWLDIHNLPDDCADNVIQIVNYCLKNKLYDI